MSNQPTTPNRGRLLAAAVLGVASIAGPTHSAAEWVAPPEARDRVNPLEPGPDVVKRGARLFVRHCVICHGSRGKGDGPQARMHAARSAHAPQDLTRADVQDRLTDGEIFWKVSTGLWDAGKVVMPAFEGTIHSEDDRWAVVHFVRSLRPAPEPAPEEP